MNKLKVLSLFALSFFGQACAVESPKEKKQQSVETELIRSGSLGKNKETATTDRTSQSVIAGLLYEFGCDGNVIGVWQKNLGLEKPNATKGNNYDGYDYP